MKKLFILICMMHSLAGLAQQGELIPPQPNTTSAPSSSTPVPSNITNSSSGGSSTTPSTPIPSNPCQEFKQLNDLVRDGLIGKEDAKIVFKYLIPQLQTYFKERGGVPTPRTEWRFPLLGYTHTAIGGKNGSGYTSSGFDYFDGNKSKAHPAHDIFIKDANQDELDDATYSHVPVVAVSSGVVVVSRNDWFPGDESRGGNSVVIYDPGSNAIFSYAHNAYTLVSVGEIVTAGQQIAVVGRSGKNASAQRSPTHLHLSFYKISDLTGLPYPENTYHDLVNSSKRGY